MTDTIRPLTVLRSAVQSICDVEASVGKYLAGEKTSQLAAEIWTKGTVARLGLEYDLDFARQGKILPRVYVGIYERLSDRLETTRKKYMEALAA